MRIDANLSVLSQNELNKILYKNMSFEEALEYMNEGLHIRTFSETLTVFYGAEDLRKRLIEGMFEIEQTLIEGVKQESVERNVRNWLAGVTNPERKTLWKMCFALAPNKKTVEKSAEKTPEEIAGAFLACTSDGSFHLRNPYELALAFGLRTGKSYIESRQLWENLKPLEADINPVGEMVFTQTIADLFELVQDDESFVNFYNENYKALGVMHNTAYEKCFKPFMDTLICPNVPRYFDQEKKYSVRDVVSKYLRTDIPFDRESARYVLLQRTVRKYWPDVSSINKMFNRTKDVSRKVLLLLYLVTGGQRTEGNGKKTDTEYLKTNEEFENHYWKLNAMLNECGFSLLDPRNTFDWLVLFCLKADDRELMDERLQKMLRKIFSAETD